MWPIFLMLLFLSATPAIAAPTVTCHCFQDRSFDPQRPSAADPYILATAQNSLLAAAFGLPKKEVVRVKMAGTSGDRLWVVHYLAAHLKRSAEEIDAERVRSTDWQGVLRSMNLDPAALSSRFVAILLKGGNDEELAAAAADATLETRLGADPAAVEALRKAGASNQETILALFLERRSGHPPLALFRKVKSGNATWGEILSASAIEPMNLDDEIGRLLRR